MTAAELRGKLALPTALSMALAFGWARGLRTPGELAAVVLPAGLLAPLPALLLGAVLGLGLSLLLVSPFALREGAAAALDGLLHWVAWALSVAALTYGVTAAGAWLVGTSAPADPRLEALAARVLVGGALAAGGWLVLGVALEIRRRVHDARDLAAGQALRERDPSAALARCEAALARWDGRELARSAQAVEVALLRATLLAARDKAAGAAAFSEVNAQLEGLLAGVDDLAARAAGAAEAAGLPGAALEAWLGARRATPAARDQALAEVARLAEHDPGRVLAWAGAQGDLAARRRDAGDLEALAALAAGLGGGDLARELRERLSPKE